MAARQGARVLLVEGQGCFGGMGTSGLVPAFMQFGDGVNLWPAVPAKKLLDRLRSRWGGTTAGADGRRPHRLLFHRGRGAQARL